MALTKRHCLEYSITGEGHVGDSQGPAARVAGTCSQVVSAMVASRRRMGGSGYRAADGGERPWAPGHGADSLPPPNYVLATARCRAQR